MGVGLHRRRVYGDTLIAGVHRPPRVEVHLSRDGGATWEWP